MRHLLARGPPLPELERTEPLCKVRVLRGERVRTKTGGVSARQRHL